MILTKVRVKNLNFAIKIMFFDDLTDSRAYSEYFSAEQVWITI